MSRVAMKTRPAMDWNVLTSPWLEVVSLRAECQTCSPLEAIGAASEFRCIAAASPLDFFAAHRFLLTLLYWKADLAGGIPPVRDVLLKGRVPPEVLDGLSAEISSFCLFDAKRPFLQDPTVQNDKPKSAGSLFSEFACRTNIAHFHHGDDKNMRLCLRCATIGMLRVIPWTQSGGQGLFPSVHNAPPIMAVALGENLATTLGLNLIPLPGKMGKAQWSGEFKPTDKTAAIPPLQSFTWNPRRIHLVGPEEDNTCWRCGQFGLATVGPIVYRKNEHTAKRADGQPFQWQDPAAFYSTAAPYTTIKSGREESAVTGEDLAALRDEERSPVSAIVAANADHRDWCLIVPCTNPAHNKTFDHRCVSLPGFDLEAIGRILPVREPRRHLWGRDGWSEPQVSGANAGPARFIHAAIRLLTHRDWTALGSAANRAMHESPMAFDILSGLLWSLRGKVAGLPSRSAAWLVLKLMAGVPAGARVPRASPGFCPVRALPRRQPDEVRAGRPCPSPYPISFPRGRQLEADLRYMIERHLRRRVPKPIDWAGLCCDLNYLLNQHS